MSDETEVRLRKWFQQEGSFDALIAVVTLGLKETSDPRHVTLMFDFMAILERAVYVASQESRMSES